jgi:hypothetical protein
MSFSLFLINHRGTEDTEKRGEERRREEERGGDSGVFGFHGSLQTNSSYTNFIK